MGANKYICRKCGSENVEIKQAGKQTGAYCKDCKAWIKWLNNKEIKEIYAHIKELTGGNGKAFRTFIKRKGGITIIKCSNCNCQLFNSDAPEPVGQFNLLNASYCPKCGAELY
jgi:DNA-directed RNA polymerase subunit RPC12/RpoP